MTCPDCGQKAAEKAGDSISDHQKSDDSRETCPGSGKTAN